MATFSTEGLRIRCWLQWAHLCLQCLTDPTPCFVSQGRDLRLCLWDLAEGRNTVVDSVHLDSVGFCRSSILVRGQPCWMLAVPGKGSDEVRASPWSSFCTGFVLANTLVLLGPSTAPGPCQLQVCGFRASLRLWHPWAALL